MSAAGTLLSVTEQPTPTADDGASVFIESALDTEHPCVQQSSIYTVRLYYAVTLLDGTLDASPSDGINLRQLGNDAQSSAAICGRRYNVIECHYLITPERSSTFKLPAPSFHGRAAGEGFDGMFDGSAVDARGQSKTLAVRVCFVQVADLWLPAQSIALSIDPPSGTLHAGKAASALSALRKSFAQPPRWRDHRVMEHGDDVLPPLYPR